MTGISRREALAAVAVVPLAMKEGLMGLASQNNILAGTNLARAQIRSPNYVPGVSGWIIKQDGSVEFNSGTFRGTIVNGGTYIYTGVPGLGNPPIAWFGGVLTDPFGNALPTEAGVAGTTRFGSQSGTIFARLVAGLLRIGQTADTTTATLFSLAAGQTQLLSAASAAGDGQAGFVMSGSIESGLSQPALVAGPDSGHGRTVLAANSVSGGLGVAEPWNAMVLLNSWANNAGNVTAQYRMLAAPPNNVELIGSLVATAATATTFFTLPAAYRPTHTQQFACGGTGGVTANNAPFITIDTAGNCSVQRGTIGAANIYPFHGLVALDA